MRKRFLAPLAALLAGAGVSWAEPPSTVNVVPSVRPPTVDQSILPSSVGPACDAACPITPACETCGPAGRFWFDVEYLLWFTKDARTPPLVTTGTLASAGVLGTGTSVLFGGNSALDYTERSGLQFTVGMGLDDENKLGIEASYLFLGSRSINSTAASSGAAGTPVLARPFFNTATGAADAELTAYPGLAGGSITIHNPSELQGTEANAVWNLCCTCGGRLDLIGGFRYLRLREGLELDETVSVAPTSPALGGDQIVVIDNFTTHNDFYGGQIGVRGEWLMGRFFLDGVSELALGDTRQAVDINGATTIFPPNGAPAQVQGGGLLALGSNSGRFTRDRFSVIPQETIRLGYQATNHIRVTVGYSFLYWTDVARPGDQIDPVLNPNKIPTSATFGQPGGPARPAFVFHETDYWAQGINFGLEIRY